MTPLFYELNRWRTLRHVWGESDCVILCADWVKLATGKDPAEGLRFTYATASECERVTRFFSNPTGMVGDRMQALGFSPTEHPCKGDVAVVISGNRPAAAVKVSGDLWASMNENSNVSLHRPMRVVRAWGIGYEASLVAVDRSGVDHHIG